MYFNENCKLGFSSYVVSCTFLSIVVCRDLVKP
jgi:hypothetical protein